MKPVNNETLLRQLKWRYAVKRFDPRRKIQAPDWQTLEQALVLSPSSFGLQPWKFFVIDDPQVRQKLKAASWNQSQVADASHYVVFAIRRDIGPADVDRFIGRAAQVNGTAVETLAGYRKVIADFVSRPAEQFDRDAWSARQLYIALGNFMTAAAMIGIDTCPMEGLDPAQYDQVLGLAERGYRTYCACAAGYRSADDKYALAPKVRFEPSEVIEHV